MKHTIKGKHGHHYRISSEEIRSGEKIPWKQVCGSELDAFLKAQKPIDPEMAKAINDNFWDLL